MIDVGANNVYFACDEFRLQVAHESGECLQFDHCSCDKIDAEFFAGGYCEDAFAKRAPKRSKGKRKTGRAFRRKMRRKTIKKYRDGNNWIYGPYLRGHWEGDEFIFDSCVKHPQRSARTFFKRVSNKMVRRSKDLPLKGAGYRKVFDYWWTID